jgi:hypothetical protein
MKSVPIFGVPDLGCSSTVCLNFGDKSTPSLKIRDWDAATKFASVVALLAAGLWSVWMFHATAKQQANAAEIEAQKPFAAKRLEVYEQVTTPTAAVAQLDLPLETRKQSKTQCFVRSKTSLAAPTIAAVRKAAWRSTPEMSRGPAEHHWKNPGK